MHCIGLPVAHYALLAMHLPYTSFAVLAGREEVTKPVCLAKSADGANATPISLEEEQISSEGARRRADQARP